MRFGTLSTLLLAIGLAGCGSSQSTCGPMNCPGCCSGDACLPGTADKWCGAGGVSCAACVGAQICSGGCVTGAGGGGGGGGSAGGGAAGGTGGGGGGGGVSTSCGTVDAGTDGGCVDSWTNYASGFFSNTCSGCHGSVWNDYANVQSDSLVSAVVCGGAMPPSGLDPATRARIDAWFACGEPF